MSNTTGPSPAQSPFTEAERSALAGLARLIIPASEKHGLPGADDPQILAVILTDAARHKATLARALAGFVATVTAGADDPGAAFRQAYPAAARLVETLVVQGYYRDDRVMRSLAIELRPPFPEGYTVKQGDWSLLDPVRASGRLYRETG